MLQALLLGAVLGAASGPVHEPGAVPTDATDTSPTIVQPEPVFPVTLEEARPTLASSPGQQDAEAEHVRRTDAGRFIYNVAVGVVVTVLSALILRAIL